MMILRINYRHREVDICNELMGWENTSVTDFPRSKEAVVEEIEPFVVVRTRTGGRNREEYQDEIAKMRSLPNFDHDKDDSFDRTYMYFWYQVPKKSMRRYCEFIGKEYESGESNDSNSNDSES